MATRRKRNLFTVHNKAKIVRGGADYFQGIETIADNAVHCIHIQTYIFDHDETGKSVGEALIRAVKRGVQVYVLVDGYASQKLSPQFIAWLKAGGVHFDFFEPLFKSSYFYIGRRLHHKIVVADAAVCMVAGINVSNRYNDINKARAWLDWAVCAEGEVARQLNDICVKVWNGSPFRKKCVSIAPSYPFPLPDEKCLMRVRRNDWLFSKTEITKSYRQLFQTARTHITVMTSYFWPPRKLLRRMGAASRRGVKVRLILTQEADVPLSKYAERYLYSWLFRHNIEVYEYERNILHGKIAVCDDTWLTAGSYNVNNISAYASIELNLDIRDETIVKQVNDKLQQIIDTDCTRITEADFAITSNIFKRLLYYLSFMLVHLIFFMFTFYFIQQREENVK
jgi:cardiolipin synthase